MFQILCVTSLDETVNDFKNNVDEFFFRTKYRNLLTELGKLHLTEWKLNNKDWKIRLMNISSVYDTIDDMFEAYDKMTVHDIGDVAKSRVCIKTMCKICSLFINETFDTPRLGNDPINDSIIDENFNYGTRLVDCKLMIPKLAYQTYNSNPVDRRKPMSGQYVFAGVYCTQTIPIQDTNILGYIDYKRASLNNDNEWLSSAIDSIIQSNPNTTLENHLLQFRREYHRIPNDDRRLYNAFIRRHNLYRLKQKLTSIL